MCLFDQENISAHGHWRWRHVIIQSDWSWKLNYVNRCAVLSFFPIHWIWKWKKFATPSSSISPGLLKFLVSCKFLYAQAITWWGKRKWTELFIFLSVIDVVMQTHSEVIRVIEMYCIVLAKQKKCLSEPKVRSFIYWMRESNLKMSNRKMTMNAMENWRYELISAAMMSETKRNSLIRVSPMINNSACWICRKYTELLWLRIENLEKKI